LQIDVILPLAFNQSLSYAVPVEYHKDIKVGVRVEVALRKKYYSGIVKSIRENQHLEGLKNINTVLDEEPVVSEIQLKFWGWIAQYYVCTIGQVMAVALPTGLKLNSETTIEIHPEYQENKAQLSNKEYLMMESLHHQQEINLDKLRDILKQKSVHNFLKVSFEKRLIVLKEELREKYKPKLVDYIRFTESVGDGDLSDQKNKLRQSCHC